MPTLAKQGIDLRRALLMLTEADSRPVREEVLVTVLAILDHLKVRV